MQSTLRTSIPDALKSLPDGEPFKFNYQPSRLDRNALFALGQVFDKTKISETRTKYHRAHLDIETLRNDLLEFKVQKKGRKHNDSYYMVLESVRQDLKTREKLIPLTTGAVAKLPDFPGSKSPGLPEKLEGYKTKAEAIADPAVLDRIRKIWYRIEAGQNLELPDVACYARAQICDRDKDKIRATYGYPLTVYMQEAAYFYPVLEHLKQIEATPIAYGLEIGNGGMDYFQTVLRDHPGAVKLMGDWSRFDKTIPPWLIRDAFGIVKEMIDFAQVEDSEGKKWPVRPYRSNRRWRKMVHYFINTPVRLSDGQRFLKIGGVPSGSCWTNVIDSIINMIVMRYLIYNITGSLPLYDCYLGDDSFILIRKPINLETFAELAQEEFSMIFNFNKSYQTTRDINVFMLGYFNLHGRPFKNIDTIIASTIYPERPVKHKLETIARLIGQAYSCFDAVHSSKFFQAADILRKEERLDASFVEQYIHANPHMFKYLQTIGVKPTEIKFSHFEPGSLCFITQPHPPRKKYIPRIYDEIRLYEAAKLRP